jgi:hypothetical protein
MDEDGQMAKTPKHIFMIRHQYSLTWRSPLTELSAYPGEGPSLLQASGGPIRTPGSPTFFDAGF